MRLSKTNIIESLQQGRATARTAAKEQLPVVLSITVVAALVLLAPTIGSARQHVEEVGIVGASDEAHEDTGYEQEAGVATIIIDGQEFTDEDGSIEHTDEHSVQHVYGLHRDQSTQITVTTDHTVDSYYDAPDSGAADDNHAITVNGEEIEPSRSGRFRYEKEDENYENEIRGDIDIDTDSDGGGSNASVNITISGQ